MLNDDDDELLLLGGIALAIFPPISLVHIPP